MILRNKMGNERSLKILIEIERNKKRYLIYEDINTLNVYSGRLDGNNLLPLDDEEYKLISNMYKKISG